MSKEATQKRKKNVQAGRGPKMEFKRRPILDAVFRSIEKKCLVDVALPIPDTSFAFLAVADQLETGEDLELESLTRLRTAGAFLASGCLVDAMTGVQRTWRLRILLSASKPGTKGRR